ncbi:hypothetical protein [Ruminococcus sp.]|uniref:hypothetical protein n=1 Tax=Ruminococcus sp. TaxID=41978 RepID=UPI00388DD05B
MNSKKEKTAIEALKRFQPRDFFSEEIEPYYLCYSGGKDSDVILSLAKLAGVKFEAVHNLTTVDAPETVNYIKANPDVKIDKPELSMFQLIPKKRMPSTRCFLIWKKLTISENFTMAMCEYAWTSFNDNAKVFEYAPQDKARFHPTYYDEAKKLFDGTGATVSIVLLLLSFHFFS